MWDRQALGQGCDRLHLAVGGLKHVMPDLASEALIGTEEGAQRLEAPLLEEAASLSMSRGSLSGMLVSTTASISAIACLHHSIGPCSAQCPSISTVHSQGDLSLNPVLAHARP